jgi:hypothetical protein
VGAEGLEDRLEQRGKSCGRRLNRVLVKEPERDARTVWPSAHKIIIPDLCCIARVFMPILLKSRKRRSKMRIPASQSPIQFQGTSKYAESNGFGGDLDRITRRDDLRSGENAGGESPVRCDGAMNIVHA